MIIGYEDTRKLKFSLVLHSINSSRRNRTLRKLRVNIRMIEVVMDRGYW